MRKFRFIAMAAIALAAFAAAPALAVSGGGNGAGGAPSSSGSRVDASKRYAQGVEAFKAGDYQKADRAFKDVLEVAGKDATTNLMAGLTKVGLNDLEEARKLLRNAVKYDANLVQAHGWLGAVEAKLGDAAKAAEQKTALEAVKTRCGGSCPEAKMIDAAIGLIDNTLAKPADPLKLAGAATQYAASEQAGDAAYLEASGLINLGRYDEALASLRRAALVFGPHPDVLTYQGFANRKLHNYDVAIGFYSAALKLAPDHRGANEYLGEYYVETRQLGQARKQLASLERICKFGCEEAEELRRWIDGARS